MLRVLTYHHYMIILTLKIIIAAFLAMILAILAGKCIGFIMDFFESASLDSSEEEETEEEKKKRLEVEAEVRRWMMAVEKLEKEKNSSQ